MAAASAAASLLKTGETALIIDDAYGGTRQLFERILAGKGIAVDFINFLDAEALARAFQRRPHMVWIESPTNPLMKVLDIAEIARAGHAAGALVVVDNTFASPYLQRPLDLGADIVLYSTTKYHGGHSDVLGGALVVNDPSLASRLAYIQYITGGVPGPIDAWLVLRGMKTLALRMERHCANAMEIARSLDRHPAVADVRYPGLERHPQHALAARQMQAFGGMLSFELRGGLAAARHVCRSLKLFAFAPSLGGIESLVAHPASMTHGALTPAERATIGIPDSLVRLSIGIEAVEDLQRDLTQALAGLDR
jgi:cystathionine beta-lyase/cystathionine gamma-synthase